MSFLKKGPEIKLSGLKDVKVPGFLQDVYYDLKDRHLLPVALILLVAIVAVPIAISDSGSGAEPAGGGASAEASGAAGETSGALVAEAAPGLRKYQKRLEERGSTNPFKQKYSAVVAEAGAGGTESAGTSEPAESPSYSSSPTESGSGSGSGGGSTSSSRLIHYSYAIDVRVSGGSGEKKESTVRRNLPELTMLPSRSTPALSFVGPTKDEKKAVMIVSSDVKAIFGDNRCILGSETCEMLVLEPGLPETVVYGGAEKTYTIELLKIELIKSSELNRAALGKTGKQGKKSNRLADTLGLSGVVGR